MKQSICGSKRLVEFLDGALSNQKEKELVSHLDDCVDCARELEQLAADDSRWQDVKSHLSRPKRTGTLPLQTTGDSQGLPFAIRQVLTMLDPTDDPGSMGRMGGYEVAGVVGCGAMGVVLKAFDQTLDRVVALKVMNPTLAACGTARYRFAREAKAAAAVLHPNVIAIHSVSTDRELPYLVMPYIAGMSLQQRMNRQGPLELIEILRIGSQVAAGLAAAHQKGLIHRDIKPSNVMLDEGVETAVITDFGLARTIDDATMTRSGSITGTPEFMSPEQARGDSVDCASDMFSLGSVLYALSSGDRPFRAKTPFGVLRKITDQQPTPIRQSNPDVPVWLCTLIEQMHSKTPSKRPTATQVCNLLESCQAHVYQPDRIPLPQALVPQNSKRVSLSQAFLIGVFSIMTFLFIAILAVALQTGSTPNQAVKKGVSDTPIVSSKQSTTNEPKVFKTLNLMFPKLGEKGTLKIDINRGFVEVIGHDQPGVVIEILTPPEFDKSNEQDSKLKKFFAPKYDLDVDKKKNLIKLDTYNQDFVLNLRIKVPLTTNLSLDAYRDGYIVVKDVSGVIHTHSEHSDISLTNISGSATAFSRNGDLTIGFQAVASDAILDFESYNGAINLTLPSAISATTAISSGTGTYLSELAIESIEKLDCPETILAKVKSNVEEYQFGKINGGGVPLRIENENGVIRIRKADMLMPR